MILIKSNLKCNFSCNYCYQHPVRKTGQAIVDYDLETILNAIREVYDRAKKSTRSQPQIVLHGGEPLILPRDHIEAFLRLSFELTGRSSIQTNGYLIDEELISLFRQYKTSVGVSLDGPWPCNELRGVGSKEERMRQTRRIQENLKLLTSAGINTSLIAVLHKANVLGDRLDLFKYWLLELDAMKISGRLNPCCSGNPSIDLTSEEAKRAYSSLLDFCIENELKWSPFSDIVNSFKGEKNVVCVFRSCDPYATPSATTILPDGSIGVCIRLYHDGYFYLRDSRKLSVRDQILLQTDCRGCEWWSHCYGGCPGMAIDFDWRRKDRWCEMYRELFRKISKMVKFCLPRERIIKQEIPAIRQPRMHSDGVEHLDGKIRHLDSDL